MKEVTQKIKAIWMTVHYEGPSNEWKVGREVSDCGEITFIKDVGDWFLIFCKGELAFSVSKKCVEVIAWDKTTQYV